MSNVTSLVDVRKKSKAEEFVAATLGLAEAQPRFIWPGPAGPVVVAMVSTMMDNGALVPAIQINPQTTLIGVECFLQLVAWALEQTGRTLSQDSAPA